ncbi:MAG: ArnT family glycosyltransferase [Candidatus Nanohaloarchaea archaeon]
METWRYLEENGAVLAVTLLAAALRFFRLGHSPFWQDEALYVMASASISGIAPSLGNMYVLGHPPLFFHLLEAVHLLGSSEFLMRLPVAVFGVLTVPAVFLVGERLYDKRTGLLAAVFLALSSSHLFYSRVVHPAAAAVFFSVLSVFLLLEYLEHETLGRLAAALTAGGLALSMHFVAYFLLLLWPYLLYREELDVLESTGYGLTGIYAVSLLVVHINAVKVLDFSEGRVSERFFRSVSYGSLREILAGALSLAASMLAVLAGVDWLNVFQGVLRNINTYWGQAYLFLPLVLAALPAISREEEDLVLYAWAGSAITVIAVLSGFMRYYGYGPVRLYPFLLPAVLLLAARGLMILDSTVLRRLLLAAMLMVSVVHLPQVYGMDDRVSFSGAWYTVDDSGTRWMFGAGAVSSPGMSSLAFEARSYPGPRDLTVLSGSNRTLHLNESWQRYRLEDLEDGEVLLEPSGGCVIPARTGNSTDKRCLSVGIRDVRVTPGTGLCDLLPCLERNPLGVSLEKDWRAGVREAAESAARSEEFYVSYPAVFLYYSSIDPSRVKSLRWNIGHYHTNLSGVLGEEGLWIVTDEPRFREQLYARERSYVHENCGFREVEGVWLFHCPAEKSK